MVARGARVRAVSLALASLLVAHARAQQCQCLPSTVVLPNLTAAAALADGSKERPYQAILKECYPFAMRDDETGTFYGYHFDQINMIDTKDAPFNINYTLVDATFDGALELLR